MWLATGVLKKQKLLLPLTWAMPKREVAIRTIGPAVEREADVKEVAPIICGVRRRRKVSMAPLLLVVEQVTLLPTFPTRTLDLLRERVVTKGTPVALLTARGGTLRSPERVWHVPRVF